MDSVALCNHLMSSTGLFTCLLNTQNQLRGVQVADVCHQTSEDWSRNARYVRSPPFSFFYFSLAQHCLGIKYSLLMSHDHLLARSHTNICDACLCSCGHVMSAFFHEYIHMWVSWSLQEIPVFMSFFLRLGGLNLTSALASVTTI